MRTFIAALSTVLALSANAELIVFRDANVISMTSSKVVKQTVVVSDGQIVSVGATPAKLPDTAVVIDASGKYLMPGLSEMHGHIPPPNSPPGLLDDVLFLYLANGIF